MDFIEKYSQQYIEYIIQNYITEYEGFEFIDYLYHDGRFFLKVLAKSYLDNGYQFSSIEDTCRDAALLESLFSNDSDLFKGLIQETLFKTNIKHDALRMFDYCIRLAKEEKSFDSFKKKELGNEYSMSELVQYQNRRRIKLEEAKFKHKQSFLVKDTSKPVSDIRNVKDNIKNFYNRHREFISFFEEFYEIQDDCFYPERIEGQFQVKKELFFLKNDILSIINLKDKNNTAELKNVLIYLTYRIFRKNGHSSSESKEKTHEVFNTLLKSGRSILSDSGFKEIQLEANAFLSSLNDSSELKKISNQLKT